MDPRLFTIHQHIAPSQLTVIEFNHCSLFLLRFQQYHLVARELLKLLLEVVHVSFYWYVLYWQKKKYNKIYYPSSFDGSMTAGSCQYTSDTTDVIN